VPVNVGLYFDLRNPPQWQIDWSRLYGFTLEMCEEADRLGVHSIWVSEHHLFDDGYLPQTLTMAAAIAARTKRVRIGTAILIAPLHHAAEIAEQAAIVDILSDGRLEVGLGTGYRLPEFELFDVDMRGRYDITDGRVRELRKLWSSVVTPAPVQPEVPIWMGYQGPKGAARAGRLGEGLLSLDPSLWPPYRDALVAAGHDSSRGRMAGGLNSWATEDPERDWPLVSKHVARQFDSYRSHMVQGTDQPVPKPIDPDRLLTREPFRGPLGWFLYGTPEHLASRIQELIVDAPVETVFFWASISGMPEEMVARQVQVVCTELAPLLAGFKPTGSQ
jgi:alkanesulfonate monooxygenase SsuD/methylene tetrahydromethanopterin reductase-like flavin-dependent oxidoreductase (luciferase family)